MNPPPDADAVIDLIDTGQLRPLYHQVIRIICDQLPLGSGDRELLAAIDKQEVLDAERRSKELCERIEALPVDQESIARLLRILLLPNEPMDWFGAEMVIHWARQVGVPEDEICRAFGIEVPSSP